MRVRERLYEAALERDLRRSTLTSYERLLDRLGVLDLDVDEARQGLAERLWTIDNPNTRRAAAIACRAVLGVSLRVPRAIPRKYDLPSEDTLRLALMHTPHEVRGLLMLYCGLRVGEACAVTHLDMNGDALRVDKQVVEGGGIGPVKSHEATVTVPRWLGPMVLTLQDQAKPASVRESFRRAGRKVGIALNPHLLRHACATMLLERGVPVAAVSRHLRHSDVATTLRTYAQHDTGRYVHDVFG